VHRRPRADLGAVRSDERDERRVPRDPRCRRIALERGDGGDTACAQKTRRSAIIDAMVSRAIPQLLATLAAAASLAGCALLLVSTEGLSGGALDAASTPGADGAEDGALPGEGGPQADVSVGPIDAAIDGDGSLGFCAANPGHTFCDDFDQGTDLLSKWSNSDVKGRGVIQSDATLARSAPRSFKSSTPAGASVVSVANLDRELGMTDRIRLSFDFNATQPTASVGDSVATLRFAAGYFDLVWFDNGKFGLTERADPMPPIDHFSPQFLTDGAWARLQIEVTPGRLVVKVDGVSVIDAVTTRPYSGAAGITIGLYSQDTQAITFHYDNVLIDTAF
jgi:hypothetical protein